MPWRTLTYKALNTFVDDLFAFIIKMPTMHRLSCLRDDLIFVIYIYQRWKYGVDSKRANEYGQVGQTDQPAELAAELPDRGSLERKPRQEPPAEAEADGRGASASADDGEQTEVFEEVD